MYHFFILSTFGKLTRSPNARNRYLKLWSVLFIIGSLRAATAARIDVTQYEQPRVVTIQSQLDITEALQKAVSAANEQTALGAPTCVYVPSGRYLIRRAPPRFKRAGCLTGDGSSETILTVDPSLQGDLFSWSEAWAVTTPGPRIVGISIEGNRSTTNIQNAFVFYDRVDEVYIDDVSVSNLRGRALYFGVTSTTTQAYIRESHIRSLRLFRVGADQVPVIEISSEGGMGTDGSNEVRMSQIDIYSPYGPGLIIRNNSEGHVRNITVSDIRVEGHENGAVKSDLIVIGDKSMMGNVNSIRLTNVELLNPYPGQAALRVTAKPGSQVPYHIYTDGFIGGGLAHGQGLRVDAGRNSTFKFMDIHTEGTNVVLGQSAVDILLDGGGSERTWTYEIDTIARRTLRFPMYRRFTDN